ncbi:hypothetical protein MRX96_019475 [Rhipicephalus microplus]
MDMAYALLPEAPQPLVHYGDALDERRLEDKSICSDAGAPRCQATDLDASPGPRLDERDTDGLRLADLDLDLEDHEPQSKLVADSKRGGALLLALTLLLQTGYRTLSRTLAVDVGGAKRLNALSSVISTVLLAPLLLFVKVPSSMVSTHFLSDGLVPSL